MADIRQDKIDVVVVHRLDRLSRSLFDLSDLLPLFAVQGIDLASATQPIDTRTPDGRLTLNILSRPCKIQFEAKTA